MINSHIDGLRPLGHTSLRFSALGLGTWQFSAGQGPLGGHWDPIDENRMQAIVEASLKSGVNWFDTAESYGNGASERNLSTALRGLGVAPGEVFIADKWWPKQRDARSLLSTIETRKECLQGYPIDLYQIHWPESRSWLRTEMKALARLVHEGHVHCVGLCNYSSKLLRKAHKALARQSIPLASVQVRYSLLHRDIESNGVLQTAQDLGFSVIAWSPLEQGLLTGRFHENPESMLNLKDSRKKMFGFSEARLRQTQPLIELLKAIASRHHATAGQVALAWLVQFHGEQLFAIPGASSVEQAKENAGALTLCLSSDELKELDDLSWR